MNIIRDMEINDCLIFEVDTNGILQPLLSENINIPNDDVKENFQGVLQKYLVSSS